MKAYNIHWNYPATADDDLFYSGKADKYLFHSKVNAEKRAESLLREYIKKQEKIDDLKMRYSYGKLSQAEIEEFKSIYTGEDLPYSFTIVDKEIEFGD